jgi:Flp pilus assembly protein TadD
MRQRAQVLTLGCALALTLSALTPVPAAAASKAGSQLDFGVAMAKRGLWNEALFRFQQARRERPSDPQVLNNIAVAYEALGLFEQSLAAYKEALDASPGNRELRANYSRFLEFYQSFRPVDPQATEDEGKASDGEGASHEGASHE